TGGGYGTRELYSDDEETIFDATRPCALTGIEDLATRGDLIERSLLLRLPSLSGTKRRSERELLAAFDRDRPAILGVLLDAVSGALGRIDAVRLDTKPRMADFAEWVAAAEPTLGWKPGTFLKSYLHNREDANEVALSASPLVAPIQKLLGKQAEWEGTSTELLHALTALVAEGAAKARDWPKRAHVLGGRLRRLAPNLRAVGIDVQFTNEGHNWTRKIFITQDAQDRKTASAASAA